MQINHLTTPYNINVTETAAENLQTQLNWDQSNLTKSGITPRSYSPCSSCNLQVARYG